MNAEAQMFALYSMDGMAFDDEVCIAGLAGVRR